MTTYRDVLQSGDPDIFECLIGEENRQREGLELIPSENYTYPEVLALLGSVFTNKYSEGYPGRRYYGGQEFTDKVERLARDRACTLFRADHANVQPLSGSPMNQAVYLGLLEPGDTILAMDLSHGGHLTHGAPVSHMGHLFNFVRYKTTGAQGAIDTDDVLRLAQEHRPKLVLCGYTSYPRDFDYAPFRAIADEVGAYAMADVSHVGGLIASGVLANPMDAGFDVMTTTTHKSLRGPRGGMILCKKDIAKKIDASVFPGLQGGPHMNAVAAIAVTLKLADTAAFRTYAKQTLTNAAILADTLLAQGAHLITGGTSNHMLVVNTHSWLNMDGTAAEKVLDRVGLTTNKQIIPDDPLPPLRPSAIRLGTPAVTTRGMTEEHMTEIGTVMATALTHAGEEKKLAALGDQVRHLADGFPVPGLAARDD